ncbi:hypothetical protein AWB83_05210 [Caballeronia ptereochthonis]|uniref:Uncharacterized protein n=1 Tax=Caballeronia ptereochthonis TaxID=1777144 RepID=A0A158DC53_9BURK|nr:hypothetical protein AWB83_05210 [Caballeronia ptereochthonis]
MPESETPSTDPNAAAEVKPPAMLERREAGSRGMR